MGTKQSAVKVTEEQRKEFVRENWELFKNALPVQMNAKHQYVVKVATLAREKFGYSPNTWNSDIVRGFNTAFFAVVEELKSVPPSMN